MTWAQLQDLRAAARDEIQRQMELIRPHGGTGVQVNGNFISIQAAPREDFEPPFIPINIWMEVEGTFEITGGMSDGYNTHHFFPLAPVAQSTPAGGVKQLSYIGGAFIFDFRYLDWLDDPNQGQPARQLRRDTLRYEQRPFAFPVRLHLAQINQHTEEIIATATVDMPNGVGIYHAYPARENVYLEVRIIGISSL